MKWVRLPSPAMVIALGALVLSVGGNVTAAVLITSADIKDNTLRSVDIRDETIKSADIDNGALKGMDVANSSLTGADVANGSLAGGDVANNSLTGADVLESSLGQVPSAARATTAQNAGKVDGLDANSLTRVAQMGTAATLILTTDEQTYGPALSITAPRAGFVTIHGSTTIANLSCTTDCAVTAHLRHVETGNTSVVALESISPGQVFANTSHASVLPVNAGVNTFDIRVERLGGNGRMDAFFAELAAIYSPFGPTGAATLGTGAATTSTKALDGN
jgi:hypothetical protein